MSEPGPEPPAGATAGQSVVLHSSWRGILLSHATPLLLVVLGGLATADAGPHPIALALMATGVALEAVSLLDFPLSAVFGPEGIERRCLLRRRRLAWSEVDDLRRAPGPRLRRVPVAHGERHAASPAPGAARGRPRRGRGGAGPGSRPAPGGLVAARGRRRYLLVDRVEGGEEYDALVRGVSAWAPGLAVHALRPPDGTPPTWLYRRRPADSR